MVTSGIVSGWALTHVENHNPAFFFWPFMHWKTYHQVFHWKTYQVLYLNFSAPDNFSVQIILTCSTCLQITFIQISEQPKTSWFLVILSNRSNRAKVSHNQILIGCLAVKLIPKLQIESSKPYFYLAFFEKKQ